MIEELLFIHRFGVWDTVVCLAFVFFIISLCFSFGDIRLGWLSCFVWAEKSFLQLGVFNTQTLFEFFSFFFFWGGGCIFFTRLDSRTYRLVWDRKCSSSYLYILVCANFFLLSYFTVSIATCLSFWGLNGVKGCLLTYCFPVPFGRDLVFNFLF